MNDYSKGLNQKGSTSGTWYSTFQPDKVFGRALLFPNLPPLYTVLPDNLVADPTPYQGDEPYRFDKDHNQWQLQDRLLANLGSICPNNQESLLEISRLFLLHEHVHDHHCLTANTAREVGKFQNCLEHLDYAADTYALFHEFNFVRNFDPGGIAEERDDIQSLANLIENLIKSFWAFEREGQNNDWEVRRLRRYLNWYWRHIQMKRAQSLEEAVEIIATSPKIEIAGLRQRLRGRRVVMVLDKLDPNTQLELGIVLKGERFFRLSQSANSNLQGLLNAFCNKEHDKICDFFRSFYDFAKQTGGPET